jgi:hypothetical protein
MTAKCNISFESKYAMINGAQIDISEYLSGNHSGTLRCISNGHELIPVRCTKRQPHFRHKDDHDLTGSPMTLWHREWQSNFPLVEQEFERLHGQWTKRRADIVIPEYKQVIEIQHSNITPDEVKQRINDYGKHNHEVKWIIHGQDSIEPKFLGENRRILQFNKNLWLYESFKSASTVYYDINGYIYRVDPNLVKQDQVDVLEPKLKSEFIDSLKENNTIWEDTEPPQCFLYVKQQGAGSGKTYGVMQFIDSDPLISNYKYIIFVTKQHSAVSVMYKEFIEQLDNGKFKNIEIVNKNISQDPKKFIAIYINKLTNIEVKAIFATVDSFTNALAEAPINALDKFTGIVHSIVNGTVNTSRTGKMKYAGVDPVLNKESLIIIDETQDLTESYGEAFLQIVKSKYTNLCVVGDRLQSLSYKDNALTLLHEAELSRLKVIKSSASNIVRRFSNPVLIDFVNSMIPFSDFGLPKMSPHKIVDRDDTGLVVFQSKTVYADASTDDINVVEAVTEIMNLFKKEVEDNGRIPEDFLFVTPFTKKNPLMEALQIAINMFWKDTMNNNEKYISNIKNKHEYWEKIDTNNYTRYAVFHKSQETGSINTNESIHATRMVSIHSSKGDGRPVVFVIGLTQEALRIFSQISNNIIYNSLLHVAITRQKNKLYFRLEANGDDIHRRIMNAHIPNIIITHTTEFNFIKNIVKQSDISLDICNSPEIFDSVYEKIIATNPPAKLADEKEDKMLIDMGDHYVRYASIAFNVWIHCCNNEIRTKNNTKRQFYKILQELTRSKIQVVSSCKDYIEILTKNTKTDVIQKIIPIIQYSPLKDTYDYNKYYTIINSMMNHIITKIGMLNTKEIEYFCPIECVVLFYMIECTQHGKWQSITIDNIYNIVDTYSKVFTNSKGHENCKCNNLFSNNKVILDDAEKKYQQYLQNHYNRLNHITTILDNFNKVNLNVNWLYSHPVEFGGGIDTENKDFTLSNKYQMIGYDNNNVYIINIKPQFNDLNFNVFLINSIIDTYIVSNTSMTSPNYKRFHDKNIISCVISMNNVDMYTVDWTSVVKKQKETIKSVIFDAMKKKFINKHSQYYNTFLNIIRSNIECSAENIIEICTNKSNKINSLPEYIKRSWTVISSEIDDCDDKDEMSMIIKKYSDEKVFIRLLDKQLNNSLKRFLCKDD